MEETRKIIEIDEEKCDGCGNCVPGCAEGALEIVDGKARVIADRLCDGLGACLGECPRDALRIVERPAEAFDEAAVESHLARQSAQEKPVSKSGGCPSAGAQILTPGGGPGSKFGSKPGSNMGRAPVPGNADSALGHWPIQIRLVPPTAPFLKGADLLVLADCAAVALPGLHRDWLPGRVVLMGCPKFDDRDAYVEKFAEIFRTADVRSVTTVAMEVPCCAGMPEIVARGRAAAGVDVPLRRVVVGRNGGVTVEGEAADDR
jgi:Pyruvate/2-oxoacid:ferredoxin oxidoreductase delta subunit